MNRKQFEKMLSIVTEHGFNFCDPDGKVNYDHLSCDLATYFYMRREEYRENGFDTLADNCEKTAQFIDDCRRLCQ